jgi:hypothetical protein
MLRAGMDVARFELTPDNQKEVHLRMHNLNVCKEILSIMNERDKCPELERLQRCKIMVDIAEPTEPCTLLRSQ